MPLNTIEGGLKNTDNCPACGRAMRKHVGRSWPWRKHRTIRLICEAKDHIVRVYLKELK